MDDEYRSNSEIHSLADLTNLGVKEISVMHLHDLEFSSVNEVMKFKDILLQVFQKISILHELSIREVSINGKSCNLQLLQLYPSGIVSQLKTVSLQLKPYAALNTDKLEGTLSDFFVNLRAVEHLSISLDGDTARSRALCK